MLTLLRADRYIAYRGTQISRRRSPGARGGRVILTVNGNISRAGDRRRRNILYSDNLYTLTEVACHIGRPPRPRDRVVVVTYIGRIGILVLTSLELIVILPTAAHRSVAVAVPVPVGVVSSSQSTVTSPGQVIVGA